MKAAIILTGCAAGIWMLFLTAANERDGAFATSQPRTTDTRAYDLDGSQNIDPAETNVDPAETKEPGVRQAVRPPDLIVTKSAPDHGKWFPPPPTQPSRRELPHPSEGEAVGPERGPYASHYERWNAEPQDPDATQQTLTLVKQQLTDYAIEPSALGVACGGTACRLTFSFSDMKDLDRLNEIPRNDFARERSFVILPPARTAEGYTVVVYWLAREE